MQPIDILKNTITTGDVHEKLRESLGVLNTRVPILKYTPIDMSKFGKYFNMITGGALNSIIKRSTTTQSDRYQYVVKDRIGYRVGDGAGGFTGNGKYADKKQIFTTLSAEHIPLVCKKEKRAIVEDFVSLKNAIQTEFKDIEAFAMDFVTSEITISDIFILAHKRPKDGTYGYRTDGFICLNPRVVMKDDINIRMVENGNWYGMKTISDYSYNNYDPVSINGSLELSCSLNESKPSDNIFTPPTINKISLFDVSARGRHAIDIQTVPFSTTLYDTYFDGIDITGMVLAVGERLDKMNTIFDNALEELADKYSAEMVMFEICNGDSAI